MNTSINESDVILPDKERCYMWWKLFYDIFLTEKLILSNLLKIITNLSWDPKAHYPYSYSLANLASNLVPDEFNQQSHTAHFQTKF
jgi:hypothetical protein